MTDLPTIDARGMLCPLPVLRLRKALLALPPGGRLRLWATDPMAHIDVPHFCAQGGHMFIGVTDLPDGGQAYEVARGTGPATLAPGDDR